MPPNLDFFGDPLPAGAVLRLGTVRLRHGIVHSLAFGPKGDFIVSGGSNDAEVRVWDTRNGKEIAAFPTHEDPSDLLGKQVFAVAVHTDGDLVAAASGLENCCVYLFSLSARKQIAKLQTKEMNGLKHLAFSSDGKLLACCGQAKQTFVWDVVRRQLLKSLPTGRSAGIAFSPDGLTLIVATQEREIRIYDLAKDKLVKSIAFASNIESMDLAADGRTIACLLLGKRAERNTIQLTNVSNGKVILEIVSKHRLKYVRFMPDGETVFADGEFWNYKTGQLLRQIEDGKSSVPAIARDGKTLASGLRLWDLTTESPLCRFSAHRFDIEAIGFLPDGRLMTGSFLESTFRFWDRVTGESVKQMTFKERFSALACSHEGKRLAGGFDTESIQLYDTEAERAYLHYGVDENRKRSIGQMVFSPDGTMLGIALGGASETGGMVSVIDAADGSERWNLVGHEDDVRCIVFSPSGRLLASGSQDRTVRLWDLGSGKELRRFPGHTQGIACLAMFQEGRWPASGSFDDTIRIWDIATGKAVCQIKGEEPTCLAFSPRSTVLAWAGSRGAAIHLFDVSNQSEICQLNGHRGAITSLSFSDCGTSLASGSEDTTGLVWNVSPFC